MNVARWVGIPYRWRAEPPEAADCWTLVRAFCRAELGLALPRYPHDTERDAVAVIGAETTLGARWRHVETPQPGDVLVFRWGGFPAHCGVFVGGQDFLHSLKGRNSCVERLSVWRSRLVGAYRWTP